MDIELKDLIEALAASDWQVVVDAVDSAEKWLQKHRLGDGTTAVLEAIIRVSTHRKWEVRHAVATLAASASHPEFEPVLARFLADDNLRVREAAKRAAVRRRDWQNAGAFGREHENRINATLDDIEAKFGVQGRRAVKRASDQIADTFARELYHEIIKIVVPVASAADRLGTRLADQRVSRTLLADDAETIARTVSHLKAVLDAMRAYTASPQLEFEAENVRDLVAEAITLVRQQDNVSLLPANVDGDAVVAEVSKARMIQALTNLLHNAIEAYEGVSVRQPIVVRFELTDGFVSIEVSDFGTGMRSDVLAAATALFRSTKKSGTGFGLPLVKKIVEAEHAGRLTLASELHRGTTVRLTIPTRRSAETR